MDIFRLDHPGAGGSDAGLAVDLEERRFPLRSSLAVAAALFPLLPAIRLFGSPFSTSWLRPSAIKYLVQMLDESELTWLLLPLAGLGLYETRHRAIWVGLLWGLLALVSTGSVTEAAPMVMGLFLAGLGIEQVVRWITAQGVAWPERLQRHPRTLIASLALLVSLPLGIAQANLLWQRYQSRPIARHKVEQQVGDWLSAHSEPGAIVFSSGRIGYLSNQPVVLWQGDTLDRAGMSSVMDALQTSLPRYCVSANTIAWHWLTRTGWFRARYEPLQSFEAAYDPTVWGYRASEFDRGELRPAEASLPGGIRLVGHRYWPERIEPGDAVYATLFFQSTQSINSAFRAVVRVRSPTDGTGWAQADSLTPRSIPVDWWQEGQVIAERFTLTTATETPVGAYDLDLWVPESDVESLVLGYVAVPWQGKMGDVISTEARFSDEIRLLGYKDIDITSVKNEIDVTLYWEALRPPDGNYTVFVHLVDPDGRQVTSHDGIPMDRRYPTQAWIPGEVVPDVHRLPLKPGIPAGTYLVKVGMYSWPSLERLPVWDRSEDEQIERAVSLLSIKIP